MKTQSIIVLDIKQKIQITLKLISLRVKSLVLQLLDLESQLEEELKKQMTEQPRFITLVSYRNKGINAYLVKDGENHTHNDYGTPIDQENKERAYRKKRHTVNIRIDNLADGIYRYVEAGGADFNKICTGYLLIKDGKITEESNTAESLIVGDISDLPELEGSQKQIDWAIAIREKMIATFKKAGQDVPSHIMNQTSAKWFIENRPQATKKVRLEPQPMTSICF